MNVAFGIVKGQIFVEGGPRFGYVGISVQIDLLVFDGAPKPFNKEIAAPRALAVHGIGDP